MNFEFVTANRLIFGAGKLREIGALAAGFGTRMLVVIGGSPERAKPLLNLLDSQNLAYTTFTVGGEPQIERIQAGVALGREFGAQLVIGFGGGSVMDSAKAIAALITNPGEPLDYLEVIGKGQKLTEPPLPVIAIPTTAGTGSEVTANAVLASATHQVKVSLRSPMMLPRIALVDPELTYSLPRNVTAYTGMDALTQVLEPFVTHLATPVTDGFCREGLTRAARSLRRAYDDGTPESREDMAMVSLFGGIALTNAKLGAVHGFAGVLGGMYDAPHGAICAALLPHATAVNLRAMRDREPDNPALHRYTEAARILTGNTTAQAEDLLPWLGEFVAHLDIRPLSAYGIVASDFPTIVEKSASASSMKGNPITLTSEELTEILTLAT